MITHGPGHLIAQGIEVGAAVVINHALWITGGAGGVVEGNSLPLVLGPLPGELRVALSEERFVVQRADGTAFAVLRIVHIHHQRRIGKPAQGLTDHRVELTVGDQHLGLAVLQHEGNGLRIQTHIQSIEDRAGHRHTEVRFEHRRDVGQHDRHRIALAYAPPAERTGQASAALIGLLPVAPHSAVDHRWILTVDRGRTLDEAQWREGNMVD